MPILYFPLYYKNRNATTTDSRLTTIWGEETPIAPLDAFGVLDTLGVLDVVGTARVEEVAVAAVTTEEDDGLLDTASAC